MLKSNTYLFTEQQDIQALVTYVASQTEDCTLNKLSAIMYLIVANYQALVTQANKKVNPYFINLSETLNMSNGNLGMIVSPFKESYALYEQDPNQLVFSKKVTVIKPLLNNILTQTKDLSEDYLLNFVYTSNAFRYALETDTPLNLDLMSTVFEHNHLENS